jgi:DNA polymerase-3 subunit alpha
MAANLSSEVNNPDKIVILIDECRRLGITVVPPDVNHSQAKFRPLAEDKIAFGMAAIKNVGIGAIESIIKGREEAGQYKNIYQMLQQIDMRLVNKKVLESLAQCGALDSLEGNRAQIFHHIEKAVEFGQNFQSKERRYQGQRSLFEAAGSKEELVSYPVFSDMPDWSRQDKLKKEKEFLGFYISGHPLENYGHLMKLYATDFNNLNGNTTNVSICGLITDIRTMIDKKQNKMAFLKLEDINRTYEAVVFGSVFPKIEDKIVPDAVVMLRGKYDSQSGDTVIKIICEEAYRLDEVPALLTQSLMLHIDKSKITQEKIVYLRNLLKSHPGKLPLYFKISTAGNKPLNMVSKKVRVSVNTALINELEKILHISNIKVQLSPVSNDNRSRPAR